MNGLGAERMAVRYVKCGQKRDDCVCISKQGYCIALENTEFRHPDGSVRECPFYKKRKEKTNE